MSENDDQKKLLITIDIVTVEIVVCTSIGQTPISQRNKNIIE